MMQHNRSFRFGTVQALVLAAGLMIVVGQVAASPTPGSESAVLKFRIFNDDSDSTINFGNSYPTSIFIEDTILDGDGVGSEFANLHNWHFSENGFNDAAFNNGDPFSYSADLVISGTGNGEAGLQVGPWWSQDVDGKFNVRTTDGEIACFGGRLPFFSFTGTFSINYVKGDTINLGIVYRPNNLGSANPATIEYLVSYLGTNYTSGPLNFDQGNPAEAIPHGLWGMLNDARVGGHMQAFIVVGNANNNLKAEWTNIAYDAGSPVPAVSTWGLALMAALFVVAGAFVHNRRQSRGAAA